MSLLNMINSQSRPGYQLLRILLLLSLICSFTARAQVFERLFSFADADSQSINMGQSPLASLIQDRNGNFYGTTSGGGTGGFGTIFKTSPSGALTTLVNFADYSDVCTNLVIGRDGNLYGTIQGSSNNSSTNGKIFRMTPAGVLTILVNFTGTSGAFHGRQPQSGLIEGSNGDFYGTTERGGASDMGTVFKIRTNGTAAGTTFTTLVEFNGTNGSNKEEPSASPKGQGNLMQAADGNFYGVTQLGGTFGKGTLFRMTPSGVLTTLVNFSGSGGMGAFPKGGLFQRADGSFYGTTFSGGASDNGTVYKITTDGTPGGTVFTTLVPFSGNGGANHGSSPMGRLVQGSDGNLYGTTYGISLGLAFVNNGTVFKMTPAGSLTTIATFDASHGRSPTAGLVVGGDGNFYGTAQRGGTLGFGTVFRVSPAGQLSTLVDFTGRGDSGNEPEGGLFQDTDGSFYGTTLLGGPADSGTVFKMSEGGDLATIGAFYGFSGAGPTNGETPRSSLIKGNDGKLYGSTSSSIFRLATDGAPERVTTLNQGVVYGDLLQDAAGNFYGTSFSGGALGRGSVFRSNPAGEMEVLVDFTGNGASSKGRFPLAGLTRASDGSFYGTTSAGGATNQGTVFRMTTNGTKAGTSLTTLLEFSGNPIPAQTSQNTAPITINNNVPASPLPSEISVASFPGALAGVRVSLNGLQHTYTEDIRVLLVSPSGRKVLLMSRAGSNSSVSDVNLTFDDSATQSLPVEFGIPLTTGTFRPTSSDNTDLPAPAPAGPYLDSLGGFAGDSAVGTWRLYVSDRFPTEDAGAINLGWSLELIPVNRMGSSPRGLVQGDDGNFYGTTAQGGTTGMGTVFKITPGGALTTLANFNGTNGSIPTAGLLKDADGKFYGTTSNGGAFDAGTVFSITPAGAFTTILEFNDTENGRPNGSPLIRGRDGSLYGMKKGSGGSVYRILTAGAPLVTNADSPPPAATSAVVQAKVNPRGVNTTVSLEFWTGSIVPPDPLPAAVPVSSGLSGFQTQLVGTTLTGLEQGTVYYYRFRAESSAGTTEGPVAIFSPVETVTTLAAPVVVALPATNIGPTSAILNGTVNARNFQSSVVIEWGNDGNTFPNKVMATPASVTGNTPVPVSFDLGNKQPGQTFFYRVVATNAGGTVTSGTQTYRNLIPATATVTNATALSTTRAQVSGFADAEGSSANIFFEYGTDGIHFPNSFAASPTAVSGDSSVEVTATLTGLLQGTTYHVRIRAQGPGGTGLSAAKTFSLSILSGLVQVFPDSPPISDGSVTVNFSPPNVGAWRFAGDTKWINSGVPSGNLATGQRVIEFIPIPGFIRPPSETVDVTGSANLSLDRSYFETPATGSGSLTLRLKPDGISAPNVPVANRAQWRIVGEATWRNSSDSLTGLAAGSYLVECKPVVGRETPPTIPVSIGTNDSQDITLTYFTANSAGGLPPLPQTFTNVSANEDLPYAHVGQIRSEVGSSTGFVVKRRVVATAGHVVFDDGKLSFVTAMQWFFQRHTGALEPRPQIPRGFYLAAGYDAQRNTDINVNGVSPGEGSNQSQALDYAALYFTEEAGRGGYGGFLASDSGDDNEFLDSTAEKVLAGYPTSGILAADSGKLHATTPFTTALSAAFGETWTTTTVRGLGGMSGGPLFVRHQSGAYFPAAIYLGGAGQTVVRAIDSDVVELFLRAEVSGNGGDNNTDGGITHTSVAGNLNITQAGSLRVNIEPPGAIAVGAAWQLNPETTLRSNGSQKSGLSPGTYSIKFKTIAGFQTPANQMAVVTGGQLTTITFTYQQQQTVTPLQSWRQTHFGTTDGTGDAADDNDFDNDGMKNIDEFTAGTNPKSETDVFKMVTITKSGSTCTTTCDGKVGRIYTLLRSTTLNGAWTRLASQGPLTSNATVTLTDTAAPSNSAFYRIEVSLP